MQIPLCICTVRNRRIETGQIETTKLSRSKLGPICPISVQALSRSPPRVSPTLHLFTSLSQSYDSRNNSFMKFRPANFLTNQSRDTTVEAPTRVSHNLFIDYRTTIYRLLVLSSYCCVLTLNQSVRIHHQSTGAKQQQGRDEERHRHQRR